jgi:hypothetical protein
VIVENTRRRWSPSECSAAIAIPTARRELARRVSGGIQVTLYWSSQDNSVSIEVSREQALDAFYHPFVHLLAAGTARDLA